MKAFAYYNEFDPQAAEWLRSLIKRGLAMDGEVDERSITDVQPSDLQGFVRCHFFAGIAGWDLALQLAGWPDDYPVWTGSCPCQPFTNNGLKLGAADPRHLWPAFFKLIQERRPLAVFGEQSADAIGKGWLDGVSADLEGEDYSCGATVLGAHSVGAPHIRQRLYWVGHSLGEGLEGHSGDGDPIHRQGWQETKPGRSDASPAFPWDEHQRLSCSDGRTRRLGSYSREVVDGLPPPLGRIHAYGNAIVPQAAAEFIQAYTETLTP
jgi:DNA (cytosine-5)-methyltransferase 1